MYKKIIMPRFVSAKAAARETTRALVEKST